jgi:RNA polymerase sigma factor (sigma-70 family)
MKAVFESKDERELIKEALGGSKTALEHLIKRHYSFIYNVALRFVLNPIDAQDLTQEAVIKAITKLSHFKQESEFRTWLYRIVFNHFLNSKRRQMEEVVFDFSDYGRALDDIPLEELSSQEQEDLRDKIADAKIGCMTGMLLCLNRDQRLVYILGELFEVDSKTGATLLKMSADNFRQQLARARKDLYNFMNDKCGLINPNNPCRCPKKTKGFIKEGWVNEQDLQFNSNFTKRIVDLSEGKASACDNLLEEKYGALFKDHPYYDKDRSSELLQDLTADPQLRSIFEF